MIRMTPNITVDVPQVVVVNGRRFVYQGPTGRDRHSWIYDDFFLSYAGPKDKPWSVGIWSSNGRQVFWGPQADHASAAWWGFVELIDDVQRQTDA
jgi:hypothetical protein